MTDIKENILEAAKELFNERGYNDVSMRNIADVLGISVGNLTYHYKRKVDLVEAVITSQHRRYKKLPVPRDLKELNDFFAGIIKHQRNNGYYFRHYTQLSQLSKKVYQIQAGVISDLHESLTGAFNNLFTAGLMKEDAIPGQREYLVCAIMSIVIYGLSFHEQKRLSCMWSLIYPTLTPKGEEVYQSLIAGKTDGDG